MFKKNNAPIEGCLDYVQFSCYLHCCNEYPCTCIFVSLVIYFYRIVI